MMLSVWSITLKFAATIQARSAQAARLNFSIKKRFYMRFWLQQDTSETSQLFLGGSPNFAFGTCKPQVLYSFPSTSQYRDNFLLFLIIAAVSLVLNICHKLNHLSHAHLR
jgi:hypothetical protein